VRGNFGAVLPRRLAEDHYFLLNGSPELLENTPLAVGDGAPLRQPCCARCHQQYIRGIITEGEIEKDPLPESHAQLILILWISTYEGN
jgi:hypothetical protein